MYSQTPTIKIDEKHLMSSKGLCYMFAVKCAKAQLQYAIMILHVKCIPIRMIFTVQM